MWLDTKHMLFGWFVCEYRVYHFYKLFTLHTMVFFNSGTFGTTMAMNKALNLPACRNKSKHMKCSICVRRATPVSLDLGCFLAKTD